MKEIVAVTLLAFAASSLGGCLIVSKSEIDESGPKVSSTTLNQVVIGETSEEWLIATLGKPSQRTNVDEHTDILKYTNTRTETSRGAVFVLFAGKSQKKQSMTTYFEVTDGIVTKHWTES